MSKDRVRRLMVCLSLVTLLAKAAQGETAAEPNSVSSAASLSENATNTDGMDTNAVAGLPSLKSNGSRSFAHGDPFEGALGPSVGFQVALNGDYSSFSEVSLAGHFIESPRHWVGIQVGAAALALKPGSSTDQQVSNPSILELGVVLHQYFTPAHTFLRPYFTFGFSGLGLLWDYREPRETDTGKVSWDFIHGVDCTAGTGLVLQPGRRLNLFAEVDAGGVGLPDQNTLANLNNNLFSDFGYLGMRAGLHWKF